ncbi:hypothetical protein [Streptomyces cellostaticus]|uniref:hypothetical protein n=1 Tax=Streptomyces cellostaticus TaxID=67285 RepID=UPI0020267828|nr:hypothetical protein [Streptomyces cellostaticus]
MRVRPFPFLLATGAVVPLVGACGVAAGQGSQKVTDPVRCTVTVTGIREDKSRVNGNHVYELRYRVHVPGEPDHEGSLRDVLNTIQVAQIVAVSKNYPCQVSRSDPDQVRIDWDEPLTASPSATPR